MDNGDTAMGNGFRLPLVISTSIKAKALIGIIKIKLNNIFLIIVILYPSNISLASKLSCSSFHLSYPVVGTLSG